MVMMVARRAVEAETEAMILLERRCGRSRIGTRSGS